jgi:hypothetical protein
LACLKSAFAVANAACFSSAGEFSDRSFIELESSGQLGPNDGASKIV